MKSVQRFLPAINALLCVAVLILLLVDAIWPLANIFLNGFVKLLLLVTCVLSSVCGVMLAARQRRRARYNRRMR